ncbi:MAG: DNA polymerase I [Planctomycetota bacterium]
MGETLYLIDTNSVMYQAFYAIRRLDDPDGRPVNAVYGLTNLLMRLSGRAGAGYLVAAMDPPGKTFRHEKFSDYKATRKGMPSELAEQIPLIKELLEAFGVPVLLVEGFEADDVIATVTRAASDGNVETLIITRDKDAKQLLGPNVKLYNSRDESLYTEESLKEEMGLTPEQVVDFLGLSGDASDNIPGVPGVGPKTALKLLHEYGSLEKVLDNADGVKGKKLAENLKNFADQARLSKELARLRYDVPIEFDFEKCRLKPPDARKLVPLFERLGFKRFLRELAGGKQAAKAEAASEVASEAVERMEGGMAEADSSGYHLVKTKEEFERLLAALRKQDEFALDTETTSRHPMNAELVGLSFSWREGEAWYVPVRGPDGATVLSAEYVLGALRPVLEDETKSKVGQNIKYDTIVLRNSGIGLRGISCDTMTAAWLLDSSRSNYGIDALAAEYLHYKKIPTSDLLGKKKSEQITMDLVPLERVCEYACEDADIAWRLGRHFIPLLEENNLLNLFMGVEMPLVYCLAELEFNGITLDTARLAKMSGEMEVQIESLASEIYKEAGEEFNIASTRQLSKILFEKRGLKPVRKTKTGYSTDVDVLEQLGRQTGDPLPALILEYRQVAKLKSTYVDALPAMVNSKTNRLHTSFNQTGTATGRLSSSDPNLQNIPVRTELGRAIRSAVLPRDGEQVLLTADYSQIELRMLAHLSEDEELCGAFLADQDIHRSVASRIYGVKPEDVTPEMRRQAKAVNFGIIYGQSPFGLSREVGISVPEAKTFIDAYFNRYRMVKTYFDSVLADAESEMFVRTILNRRRPLPEIRSQSPVHRSAARRAAMNTVLQGSAADLIKVAMNNIYERIAGDAAIKMILQIHDELVFEVKRNSLEKYRGIIEAEMSGAMRLRVPLKVNIAAGDNWLKAN